jgi:hypothetical protein
MELVRALSGLALVVRTILECVVDAYRLDDQDFVLQVDVTLSIGGQPPLARIDPARLQRASQGACQSTGRRRDDVVESGGMVRILSRRRPIVLPDLIVGAEDDRLLLGRQISISNRTSLADDTDPGHIPRLRFHLNLRTLPSKRRFPRPSRPERP